MQEKYIVFTGRPNAGKSSLVKELTGLKIPTGKRPGTTRKVTKYPLNDNLVLIDLPGLGKMSRASKQLEEKVNQQIIEFLESNTQNILLAIEVLDITTFLEVTWRLEKKGIMSVDVEMVKFLEEILGEYPLIAANKIDKTNSYELEANLKEFIYRINIGSTNMEKKTGLGELKDTIHSILVEKGYKTPFKIKSQ
ncbi:MAG: 50S ribosome-binding GTPase [Candidatus Bathyarchaeota archaeon]